MSGNCCWFSRFIHRACQWKYWVTTFGEGYWFGYTEKRIVPWYNPFRAYFSPYTTLKVH